MLQFIFQKATQEGLISPLRDRVARLHLSLYADGTVLFINPIKSDMDMTMEIMQGFGRGTGLHMNISKSSAVPIRCEEINLDEVLQNFSSARSAFPITYLGLPIMLRQLKMVHLQPFFDWAAGNLSGWQGKLLNLGGRRELVRSILGALPTYLLTALKPPKKFCKGMYKFRR
jgi:hypothetical protein